MFIDISWCTKILGNCGAEITIFESFSRSLPTSTAPGNGYLAKVANPFLPTAWVSYSLEVADSLTGIR